MENEQRISIDQECIALDAAMTHHLVDGLALEVLESAHALGFQNKELESKLVSNLDDRKVWKRNWNSLYGEKVHVCAFDRRGQHGQ